MHQVRPFLLELFIDFATSFFREILELFIVRDINGRLMTDLRQMKTVNDTVMNNLDKVFPNFSKF